MFFKYLKKYLCIIIVVLLLVDLCYTFMQFYSAPLDGDMAGGIVPSEDVKVILNNPFGERVLINNETYANPNRFFSHWAFYTYFNHMPLLMQNIFTPVESVYISCAIAKIIVHICLILILSFLISGANKIFDFKFLLSAFLISPLFQSNYYRMDIGIIDKSITYTFFYALPFAILLFYILSLIYVYKRRLVSEKKWLYYFSLIFLPVFLCLSGPLNPGVILVSVLVLIFYLYLERSDRYIGINRMKQCLFSFKSIPNIIPISIVFSVLLSVYSIVIGRNDSIHISSLLPLKNIYLKLFDGIYYQLIHNYGFSILLLFNLLNVFLLFKLKRKEAYHILNIGKYIFFFSIIYVFLLPFGGYRTWRPEVIRYDTMIPVNVGLIFFFGLSTMFLLFNLNDSLKRVFVFLLIPFLILYAILDQPHFDQNKNEKLALKIYSESNRDVVRLPNDHRIMTWNNVRNLNENNLNVQLLHMWNITKSKKKYYND